MPQAYSANWVHFLFATKNREFTINPQLAKILENSFRQSCKEFKSSIIAINHAGNHYHVLCALPKTITSSYFMKILKGRSSRVAKQISPDFYWQRGYGAFSVSCCRLNQVKKMIKMQNEMHSVISYDPLYDLKITHHPFFHPNLISPSQFSSGYPNDSNQY